MFKDGLAGKIMTKFCALRAKVYAVNIKKLKERKGT